MEDMYETLLMSNDGNCVNENEKKLAATWSFDKLWP